MSFRAFLLTAVKNKLVTNERDHNFDNVPLFYTEVFISMKIIDLSKNPKGRFIILRGIHLGFLTVVSLPLSISLLLFSLSFSVILLYFKSSRVVWNHDVLYKIYMSTFVKTGSYKKDYTVYSHFLRYIIFYWELTLLSTTERILINPTIDGICFCPICDSRAFEPFRPGCSPW